MRTHPQVSHSPLPLKDWAIRGDRYGLTTRPHSTSSDTQRHEKLAQRTGFIASAESNSRKSRTTKCGKRFENSRAGVPSPILWVRRYTRDGFTAARPWAPTPALPHKDKQAKHRRQKRYLEGEIICLPYGCGRCPGQFLKRHAPLAMPHAPRSSRPLKSVP